MSLLCKYVNTISLYDLYAVSYTHLDVYKRQGEYVSGRGAVIKPHRKAVDFQVDVAAQLLCDFLGNDGHDKVLNN